MVTRMAIGPASVNYFVSVRNVFKMFLFLSIVVLQHSFLSFSFKKVETCCWENYKQHKEKQEKLKNFKLPGFEESPEDKFLSKDSGLFEDVDDVHSWWSRYQPKVWKSLEEPYTSFWAKVREKPRCWSLVE